MLKRMNILISTLTLVFTFIVTYILWTREPKWAIIFLILILFGFLISGIIRWILPDFTFPEPSGSIPVGTTNYKWASGPQAKIWYPAMLKPNDENDGYLADFNRSIMGIPSIVYHHLKGRSTYAYRDAEAENGHFPIIIYEHSADGFAEENTFLLTDLASHGFIVIAVHHDKSLADYPLDLATLAAEPEAFLAAMTGVIMPDRLADLSLVVDGLAQLNEDSILLQGRLDLSQINFVGYSLGGGIVTDYCATRSHCKAVVNLDGNPFIHAFRTGITAPYLHISQSTIFELAGQNPGSPTAQMADLYLSDVQQVVQNTQNNVSVAEWWLLKDSGHASFTDFSYWIAPRWGMLATLFGTVDTESAQDTIRQVVREFLKNPGNTDEALLIPFPAYTGSSEQ